MKHKLRNHKGYPIWNAMMARCYNPKNKSYKNYGARGIIVCEEWKDVATFIKWYEANYEDTLQLDRINNDGNYEPSNCRFTTKNINCQNTRCVMSTNTTGFRGVSFEKRRNKYRAQIVVDSVNIHLGYFNTPVEASEVYDKYVFDNNLNHTTNKRIA